MYMNSDISMLLNAFLLFLQLLALSKVLDYVRNDFNVQTEETLSLKNKETYHSLASQKHSDSLESKKVPFKEEFHLNDTVYKLDTKLNNAKNQCFLRVNYDVKNSTEKKNKPDLNFSRLNLLKISNGNDLTVCLQAAIEQVMMKELRRFKKAALFDLADIENKGDPAINLGELNMLSRLNISLVGYCHYTCPDTKVKEIYEFIEQYEGGSDEVIILSSGGGNFGGYEFNDYKRTVLLQVFANYTFLLFSQSTWFDFDNGKHLKFVKSKYSKHKHMVAMLRDTVSLNFTRENFPTIRSILAPDMAFGIGKVPRFFLPTIDIIWINRLDKESPGRVKDVDFPPGITYTITDWFGPWPSPLGQTLIDRSFMKTYNGLIFLQRGRVLITDRLHGHILAILLDIPTVIIDNKIKKISNFRNTWTKGLSNVVMANNHSDAVTKALLLLETQKHIVSFPSGK